jgi:hypothetical protein
MMTHHYFVILSATKDLVPDVLYLASIKNPVGARAAWSGAACLYGRPRGWAGYSPFAHNDTSIFVILSVSEESHALGTEILH